MTKYEKVRRVAESVLQPGEAVKYYTYGMPPQGCLFILVLIAWILSSAIIAGIISSILFGRNPIVGFIILLIVATLTGKLWSPLFKPTVIVLTDKRVILVKSKPSYFRFAPEVIGIEKEYSFDAFPVIKLKQFVRRFTLTFELDGSTRKVQVVPWAENVDAARDIVSEFEDDIEKGSKLSILS